MSSENKRQNSSIELVIKKASYQDIIPVNEMLLKSFSYWDYTTEELNKIMDLYKVNEDYLAKHEIDLVYHNNAFFGFFSLIKNTDEENELEYFFIKKDLIGVGYGNIMWEACCNKAKSLGMKEFLIMSTSYAEGFYRKMGAKKIGSRPSKVRIGTDLPLLKFSLSYFNQVLYRNHL